MSDVIHEKTLAQRLTLPVLAAVGLFLLACLVPLPIAVHRTLSGQAWEDRNPDVSLPIEVVIEGIYVKHLIPLFFDDSFSGSVRIAGQDYASHGGSPLLDFERGSRTDLLTYFDADTGEYQTLGVVRVKGIFSEIVVWYADTRAPRQLVSAPARTRQEALEMGRRLLPTELDLQ
jgi:hypothetical protein